MKLGSSLWAGAIVCPGLKRTAKECRASPLFSTLDARNHLASRIRGAKMLNDMNKRVAWRSSEAQSISGKKGAVTRRLKKQKVSLAPVKGASSVDRRDMSLD
jgi:hypothetical protein